MVLMVPGTVPYAISEKENKNKKRPQYTRQTKWWNACLCSMAQVAQTILSLFFCVGCM